MAAPRASQALQQPLPPPPPGAAPRGTVEAPVVRAKVDDPAPTVRVSPLSLPAPEHLGVGGPAVDWNATHAELRRLGAVGVRLAQLPSGGYRFTFLLPTPDPGRTRHVEATGATEAEAVGFAFVGAAPPSR